MCPDKCLNRETLHFDGFSLSVVLIVGALNPSGTTIIPTVADPPAHVLELGFSLPFRSGIH